MFKQLIDILLNEENDLTLEDFQHISERKLLIKKFNWDYQSALDCQQFSRDFIRHNPNKQVIICCSHPHCFTMGSGLQKGKDKRLESLVDFKPELAKQLKYPLHHIRRGGGITFHYPGQMIIYPIVNLNNKEFTLKSLTYWLLETIQLILETQFSIKDLTTDGPFLGLWHQKNEHAEKLASVGLGAQHFVTQHGLAINLENDVEMFNELQKINPCGLSSDNYIFLKDLLPGSDLSVRQLWQQLLLQLLIKI